MIVLFVFICIAAGLVYGYAATEHFKTWRTTKKLGVILDEPNITYIGYRKVSKGKQGKIDPLL